jgi:hypothetical protein
MSQWGLHDERIYAALLDTLQRAPELGANYLVDYVCRESATEECQCECHKRRTQETVGV